MLAYLHPIYPCTVLLLLILVGQFFMMRQAVASLLYTMFVDWTPTLSSNTLHFSLGF
jgi:hypothetical protein